MGPYTSGDLSAETPEDNIPIVDLAGIDGPERQKICQQIAEACETWGLFHLINHGIDQSLLEGVKGVSMAFFRSPEEEKLKIRCHTPQEFGWRHSKYLMEGTVLVRKDTAEHLILRHYPERQSHLDRVPQQPASYKPTLVEYAKELKILGEKIFRILSEMLGLAPEALLTALTVGSSNQSLRMTMRSNFYGVDEDGEALPGVCHAHSDPGALTILLADDVPGFEVQKDGEWVKVKPISGGLIVNVGDMVDVCSNGRYKSVRHRGMPGHKQERLTLATFQSPEFDAVVAPVRSLLDENHPPRYKSTTFGAYFAAFVKAGAEGGLERQRL